MDELPDDLESKLGYCIAYGEAARLAEMARFDHGWGKDFEAAIGGDADAIEQEAKRRVGPGIHTKLFKMTIRDELDKRKPGGEGLDRCGRLAALTNWTGPATARRVNKRARATVSDLKLESLFMTDPVEKARIAGPLKNECIEKVHVRYIHDMESVAFLMALPISLVKHTQLRQNAFCMAFHEVVGNPRCDPQTYFDNEQAIIDAYKKHEKEALQELKSPQRSATYADQSVRQTIMLMGDNEQAERGSIALMEASLLNTWTAFETLAGDLWEAAVNAHPAKLATLKGMRKRISDRAGTKTKISERDSAFDQAGNPGESKSISLNDAQWLTNGTFDLSKHMGTLHKRSMRFITLGGIRESYSLAFSDHTDFIDSSLSHESLDALLLVRNLIVHKAGMADEIYVREAATVPSAPRITEGDRLKLDGEMVTNLINPVVANCSKLIKSVDSYIFR